LGKRSRDNPLLRYRDMQNSNIYQVALKQNGINRIAWIGAKTRGVAVRLKKRDMVNNKSVWFNHMHV
jgi:predicted RNA-binding protein with PUA domain